MSDTKMEASFAAMDEDEAPEITAGPLNVEAMERALINVRTGEPAEFRDSPPTNDLQVWVDPDGRARRFVAGTPEGRSPFLVDPGRGATFVSHRLGETRPINGSVTEQVYRVGREGTWADRAERLARLRGRSAAANREYFYDAARDIELADDSGPLFRLHVLDQKTARAVGAKRLLGSYSSRDHAGDASRLPSWW